MSFFSAGDLKCAVAVKCTIRCALCGLCSICDVCYFSVPFLCGLLCLASLQSCLCLRRCHTQKLRAYLHHTLSDHVAFQSISHLCPCPISSAIERREQKWLGVPQQLYLWDKLILACVEVKIELQLRASGYIRIPSFSLAMFCNMNNILQVEEHLLLYARIKGVKETRLRNVADEKMKEMDLIPFRSVKVCGVCG